MDQTTLKNIKEEVFLCFNRDLDKSRFDKVFTVKDPAALKNQLVRFAKAFNEACILNNNYPNTHNKTEFVAAFGVKSELKLHSDKGAFEAFEKFTEKHKGSWMFGYLTYDLKNDVEELTSSNTDDMNFPSGHFFVPDILVYIHGDRLHIHSDKTNAEDVFRKIGEFPAAGVVHSKGLDEGVFESRPEKADYIEAVNSLINEIEMGNIYEINYCRELIHAKEIEPYETALCLFETSPAPFSSFYKVDDHYLMCASPERFLMKSDNLLISQPIKGTKRRSLVPEEDGLLIDELKKDAKERAENVMIVDLVRNDLSHTAESGSVEVEELFGIYTFPHVHQMISTVKSRLKETYSMVEAIKYCFPMGSMTGAPKLRAMKLIEHHEQFKRGIFSGSVGLISPQHDFDFNVVIRSILYNGKDKKVSIRTGSAITAMCDPEKEWEECRLKARALLNAICD
jgi:para-aminobenzoate synthetase component 1